MSKKKAAGFKMKKSPTKFSEMPAIVAAQNLRPQGKIASWASDEVKARGDTGFFGRPTGTWGGPRGPRANIMGGNPQLQQFQGLLARAKNRKGGQRPTRRGKGGQRPIGAPADWRNRVRDANLGGDLTPEQKRQMVINERPNPYAGGGTMGQDNIIMNAAPMAKKSGFTMKRGSKPNKSEFFKGKK